MESLPVSSAAAAADEICARYALPSLYQHSVRSYRWAARYARMIELDHDSELLFVAAMLHDIALTPAFATYSTPFEVAGGHVARVFGFAAGWPAHRIDHMEKVIVDHMHESVSATEDAESHLLQVGTSADVTAYRASVFGAEFVSQLFKAHPRDDFDELFVEVLRTESARKPDCAAARLLAHGLADTILNKDFDAL